MYISQHVVAANHCPSRAGFLKKRQTQPEQEYIIPFQIIPPNQRLGSIASQRLGSYPPNNIIDPSFASDPRANEDPCVSESPVVGCSPSQPTLQSSPQRTVQPSTSLVSSPSSPILDQPNTSGNMHTMVTRAKAGIHKPKYSLLGFLVLRHHTLEPKQLSPLLFQRHCLLLRGVKP